jgi:hypothetical protein
MRGRNVRCDCSILIAYVAASAHREDKMGAISLIWGIFSLVWMLLAFIPLLGWGNWFMIPFAVVGAIIGAIGVAITSPEKRGRAKVGVLLNGIAIVVGAMRLMLGGGIV